MPGDVQLGERAVHHPCAAAVEVVDDGVDQLLVAGNGRGRDDDEVFGTDRDLVVAGRHARQRAHWLALRPRRDDAELPGRELADVLDVDDRAVVRLHDAQLYGDLADVLHASAVERDLAAVLLADVDDLLDAVDVGRERGYDDSAVGVALDDAFDRLADLAFGHRKAFALDVGRLAQHQLDALVADLRESRQVYALAVDRRIVHLEVAGEKDHPDRRAHRDRIRARDAVRDGDELHLKTPYRACFAALDGDELGRIDAVFFELVLDKGEGEVAAVDLDLVQPVLDQIGQAADVVLVAVREHDALDLVGVFVDVRKVRRDQIDARRLVCREHSAAIDDEDVVAILDRGHVLAYLPHSAQKDDFELFVVSS